MNVFLRLLIGAALMPVAYVFGGVIAVALMLIVNNREPTQVPTPPHNAIASEQAPVAPTTPTQPSQAPAQSAQAPPPKMERPNICSVLCPEYAPVIKIFDGTTTPTNPVIICCK